jgi:purine-nucleoside phosphorylase
MSTVPEAIVAAHMGIPVLGISCITNMAAGMDSQKIDHTDVLETAEKVREKFHRLLTGIITAVGSR